MKRRAFLATATATAAAPVLAGCLGGDDGDGSDQVTAAFDWQPAEPAVAEAVTFDASASTGDIAAYQWTFAREGSGETTATGETTERAFDPGGTYSVTLTVEGAGGTTDSTEQSLFVRPASLSGAVGTLATNAAELDALATEERGGPTGADVDRLNGRLDTVESTLDDVEAPADNSTVAVLRAVLTFQRRLVEAHALTVGIRDTLEAAVLFDEEVNYSPDMDPAVFADTLPGLADIASQLDQRLTLHDDLGTALDAIDGETLEALDEPALEYSQDLSAYVRYSREDLEVARDARESQVAFREGVADALRGVAAFRAERWGDAAERFTAASTALQSGEFATLRENERARNLLPPLDALVDTFLVLGAELDSFVALQGDLASAAEMADSGDTAGAGDAFDDAIDTWESLVESPAPGE